MLAKHLRVRTGRNGQGGGHPQIIGEDQRLAGVNGPICSSVSSSTLFNGGSPGAEFWRQRVEGARDRWLRGGATDESANALCLLLQDPNFWTFHSANISAWGRRATQ